jgi:hypothetical protein
MSKEKSFKLTADAEIGLQRLREKRADQDDVTLLEQALELLKELQAGNLFIERRSWGHIRRQRLINKARESLVSQPTIETAVATAPVSTLTIAPREKTTHLLAQVCHAGQLSHVNAVNQALVALDQIAGICGKKEYITVLRGERYVVIY